MKLVDSVIATTQVDRHGDRLTKGALEDLVTQIRSAYIPMMLNHDPRLPPFGRTVDAKVRPLPGGEFELVAVSEVCEPGDNLGELTGDREIRLPCFEKGKLTIVRDRSYENQDDERAFGELEILRDAHVETREKKAVEPLSVLLLAVSGAVAAYMTGLLSKAGSDTWDYVKPRLAQLLARRSDRKDVYLSFLSYRLSAIPGCCRLNVFSVIPLPSSSTNSGEMACPRWKLFFPGCSMRRVTFGRSSSVTKTGPCYRVLLFEKTLYRWRLTSTIRPTM